MFSKKAEHAVIKEMKTLVTIISKDLFGSLDRMFRHGHSRAEAAMFVVFYVQEAYRNFYSGADAPAVLAQYQEAMQDFVWDIQKKDHNYAGGLGALTSARVEFESSYEDRGYEYSRSMDADFRRVAAMDHMPAKMKSTAHLAAQYIFVPETKLDGETLLLNKVHGYLKTCLTNIQK